MEAANSSLANFDRITWQLISSYAVILTLYKGLLHFFLHLNLNITILTELCRGYCLTDEFDIKPYCHISTPAYTVCVYPLLFKNATLYCMSGGRLPGLE